MIHKDCGGSIEPDWSKTYDYEIEAHETEDGKPATNVIPAYVCQKCNVEIVCDDQIVIDENGQPIP